jgi:hypothetical protein
MNRNIYFSENQLIKNRCANRGSDWFAFAVLTAFTVFLQFWISTDSYVQDVYGKTDSACFFTAGKAWMNGLIPYVDFSDSKGPLLWLIFGLGYLINDYSTIGVFWLSCLFYTITFFFCYRIACLFLPSKRMALLISILMALFYFCGIYHTETSAEDFCQPFIASGLYYVLRLLYAYRDDKDIKLASFVSGIAFASCLMIKYNVAAMTAVFFFAVFCYLVKNKKGRVGFAQAFLYTLVGILLIVLPFTVYFLLMGNFSDFINEYFVATSQTIVKDSSILKMLEDYFVSGWGSIFRRHIFWGVAMSLLLANIFVGCLYFYKKLLVFRLFPLIFTLWFVCISMYHALTHYYQSFSIFYIFSLVMYASFLKLRVSKISMVLASLAVVAIVFVSKRIYDQSSFVFNKQSADYRKEYYYCNKILSQVRNPKVMYVRFDMGYGISVNSLPGCKYWVEQMGATEDMLQSRKEAIKQHIPDFVVYFKADYYGDSDLHYDVEKAGYIVYYSKDYVLPSKTGNRNLGLYLYGRPGLQLPLDDLQVGVMDVLLKKRIFSRN